MSSFRFNFTLLLGGLLVLLIACSPKQNTATDTTVITSTSSLEGQWTLTNIGIAEITDKVDITFDTNTHKVSGQAPCNRYNASYKNEDKNLSFGPALATKMACPNLKIESLYFAALAKTNLYSIKKNTLILYSKENVIELMFTKSK